MSTTMAFAVAIGYWGGKWLDGKFDSGPWLSLAGILLGVFAGFKAMWGRIVSRDKNDPKPYK